MLGFTQHEKAEVNLREIHKRAERATLICTKISNNSDNPSKRLRKIALTPECRFMQTIKWHDTTPLSDILFYIMRKSFEFL